MEAQQMKARIDRVEQCADDAKRAVQGGSVPSDVRDAVDALHRQASQAKHAPTGDAQQMRDAVMQIENCADRAMQASRKAGSSLDAQVQQAIQKAHAEASSLKKELMQEA